MREAAGQTTVEVAVLIAVVIAALITMQIYLKRGMQGRLRSAADSIGDPYDPRNTNAQMTLTSNSRSKTETTLERDRVCRETVRAYPPAIGRVEGDG